MTTPERLLREVSERGSHKPLDVTLRELRERLDATEGHAHELFVRRPPGEQERPAASGTRSRILFAAAVVIVASSLGAVLSLNNGRDGGEAVADGAGPSPEMTLPPRADRGTPVTAPGEDPTLSYRLAPDVELGWNQPPSTGSNICWMSPVQDGCRLDSKEPLVISTSPGQSVVVVWLEPGQAAGGVRLVLDDGRRVETALVADSQLGVGYARVNEPAATIRQVDTT